VVVADSRNERLWNGHCLQTDAAGRNYFADKSFRLTDGPLSGSIADFGLDWAAPLPMHRPRWLPTRQFPFLYTKRIGGPPRWLPNGLIDVHMAAALARLPWVELALAALKRKKMSSEAGSRIALVTKAAMGIGAAIAEQLARVMTVLVFRPEPGRGGKDSAGS
jgi:hypothetical protein